MDNGGVIVFVGLYLLFALAFGYLLLRGLFADEPDEDFSAYIGRSSYLTLVCITLLLIAGVAADQFSNTNILFGMAFFLAFAVVGSLILHPKSILMFWWRRTKEQWDAAAKIVEPSLLPPLPQKPSLTSFGERPDRNAIAAPMEELDHLRAELTRLLSSPPSRAPDPKPEKVSEEAQTQQQDISPTPSLSPVMMDAAKLAEELRNR